jgi:hypothetical protein
MRRPPAIDSWAISSASDSFKALRDVSIARAVILESVPLKVGDRDDSMASLSQKTIAEERRSIRLGLAASRRTWLNPSKEMSRPVKLDSDSHPSRDVREYIDIMKSIKYARLELYSIAKAGQR